MLPTLTVLLDDGTGTFPFDISAYALVVDGYNFSRGRQDWQGGVTSGSLTLVLNNSDGRFTPGSTKIASPSPIKVDQRIRLKETVNGTTFTRFTGYVKSWPVAWPATVPTVSTVTITATDAQARAERRTLRSVVEEEIRLDSPSAYYTLGEQAGATSAADSSGNQAPALTPIGTGTAVVFGTDTGPTTDGLTAAHFADGQWLQATLSATPGAIEFSFATTTNDAIVRPIVWPLATLSGQLYDANTHTSLGAVADGLNHDVVINGTTVYLDGTSVGTGLSGPQSPTLLVGGGSSGAGAGGFIGSIAHVAAYAGTLSAARITAHYQAISTGFAGESGTARITRIAGYAGLPLGTFDTSLTNAPFVDFTGTSAWDAMQQVTDAEGGVTYADGSGNLIFHNRNRVVSKLTPDLTLTTSFVTPDVSPETDDQAILNYFEATAEGSGNGAQVVTNAASVTSHGQYPSSASYLVQTDAEALSRAAWIVGNFAEPTTRYGTLTINLYGMSASQAATVLTALEVDCWLRVTGAPSQNTGGTTIDVIVEGYTETVSASAWTITCNVVAQSLFAPWIMGDSVRGVMGTTTRLYY
jgi:hypothetical protein